MPGTRQDSVLEPDSSTVAHAVGAQRRRAYRPTALMHALFKICAAIRVGSLTVVLPDGSCRVFQGTEPGPSGRLEIHRDRVAWRFLVGGMLAFCESYLDGDWSSPDIGALFEVTLLNQAALQQVLDGKQWFQRLQNLLHRLAPNTRRGSRRNIAAHYDLGNSFFRTWLDPSLTYSSAVFADPDADEPLEAAQARKYAEIARRLDLRPDHHVLEIGCGWGGFTVYAAGQIGARVTGITISREQYEFASRRILEAGLADRANIQLVDYRDIRGTFDRIASIEMFEAVGERYWPAYFGMIHERLAAGGHAALQVITILDQHFDVYRRSSDYIQRYIFPGGMLPSPSVLRREIDRAGLVWRDAAPFGRHYARTLREWQIRFQAAWPEISELGFDQRFKRMWEQYLFYCEAGFKVGTIDVLQVSLAKP